MGGNGMSGRLLSKWDLWPISLQMDPRPHIDPHLKLTGALAVRRLLMTRARVSDASVERVQP